MMIFFASKEQYQQETVNQILIHIQSTHKHYTQQDKETQIHTEVWSISYTYIYIFVVVAVESIDNLLTVMHS